MTDTLDMDMYPADMMNTFYIKAFLSYDKYFVCLDAS